MWDFWCKEKNTWTIPLSHEAFEKSKQEPLNIFLTPEKPIPQDWYKDLGTKVLGLASGGGQQGPLLTAHGYDVTILDNSKDQLTSEKVVSAREGYQINLVKADMTISFPFEKDSFDWILNPVSNCYIEDLTNMWQECFRVLRKGGALLTGFTNPIVYMFDEADLALNGGTPIAIKYALPYNGRELEAQGKQITFNEGYQFSHTLESQLGGQLIAGFLIKDLYEDTDHSDRLSKFTSQYLADLAIKPYE